MSAISSTSQSTSPPASPIPKRDLSPSEIVKNFVSTAQFFEKEEDKDFFTQPNSTTYLSIIYSYLPKAPKDTPENIIKIAKLLKRLGEENPGNYGLFTIKNDQLTPSKRLIYYLKIDPQMPFFDYLKEVWALKEFKEHKNAEKKKNSSSTEEKISFSSDQIEKLTAKDFSRFNQAHKRASKVFWETDIDPVDGKLVTSVKTKLFPLELFITCLMDQSIKKLWLAFNECIYYPNLFGQLKHLTDLSLEYNSFPNSFPSKIVHLNTLEELSLKGNQLIFLPETFWYLGNLKTLDLSSNRLISLPKKFGDLTKIKSLDLSINKLTSLPEEFQNLKQLKFLHVNFNKLTFFPEKLGQLKDLEGLFLQENKLTSLPEGIEKLKKLKEFNLQENPLISLPAKLSNLTSLEKLWLSKGDEKLLSEETLKTLKSKNVRIFFYKRRKELQP